MGLGFQGKNYVVAIPIPSLDKKGKALVDQRREKWQRRVQTELTKCFGGAIRYQSPGTFLLPDRETGRIRSYIEKGQTLVVSACNDPDEFLAKRDSIQKLIVAMGNGLNQASVFVLGFP